MKRNARDFGFRLERDFFECATVQRLASFCANPPIKHYKRKSSLLSIVNELHAKNIYSEPLRVYSSDKSVHRT